MRGRIRSILFILVSCQLLNNPYFLLIYVSVSFKLDNKCEIYKAVGKSAFTCDDPADIDILEDVSELRCIPIERRCDSIIDCSNGRDEVDCETEHVGKYSSKLWSLINNQGTASDLSCNQGRLVYL